MAAEEILFADADDDGFRFIFPPPKVTPGQKQGGLARSRAQGHFATIVGRGGTGKSFLALQLVTQLLKHEDGLDSTKDDRHNAAYYFSLEAGPDELAAQAKEFTWGERYDDEPSVSTTTEWTNSGLHIVAIPSPASDLSALILLIRQTVARDLKDIRRLAAIVIDPMGGVNLGDGVRNELSQLKELANSHKCFLFLLAEDHIFDRHRSIEHYSQTVIHLDYEPQAQPYRRLYIQKSRGQNFRSGYHQLEFHKLHGLRVFPSIQAQSAYAHEQGSGKATEPEGSQKVETFLKIGGRDFPEKVLRASVIFLMGPPGTFKQKVATAFAATRPRESTIYISFKADMDAVERHVERTKRGIKKKVIRLDLSDSRGSKSAIYFMEARSPLLTPELILSDVMNAIVKFDFSRAVVWGLRRLNDMPNFAGSKAVQFLEALVTLLRTKGITSLLVDWPDIEKASTLPIVDLSQYILLTRVCINQDGIRKINKKDEADDPEEDIENLWGDKREHVTFLRIQRTHRGFHRSRGVIFFKMEDDDEVVMQHIDEDYERLWHKAGIKWEQDPGLVH